MNLQTPASLFTLKFASYLNSRLYIFLLLSCLAFCHPSLSFHVHNYFSCLFFASWLLPYLLPYLSYLHILQSLMLFIVVIVESYFLYLPMTLKVSFAVIFILPSNNLCSFTSLLCLIIHIDL